MVAPATIHAEGDALEFCQVTKRFPSEDASGGERLALDNVTLTVPARELVSLIGPSGCGKSTLLRLSAGLDHPSGGELRVGQSPIIGPSAERGLVFQDPNLFP